MTIKVSKLADIVEEHVVVSGQRRPDDSAAILTNLEPAQDPNLGSSWKLDLLIGEGPGARLVKIDLPPVLSKSDPLDFPVFLKSANNSLIYFRHRIFISERFPKSASERDEIVLRVKKATYDEDLEIATLRAAVANLEATIEFQKFGPKRSPIPEDVKLVVWSRDGGSCVRCGSRQDLQFDHIIPVAKGGGNSEMNIQILCQICNIAKSDKIAMR